MATVGFVVKQGNSAEVRAVLAELTQPAVINANLVVADDVSQATSGMPGLRAVPESALAEVDLLVSLGGDGTMLRAAQIVGARPTPIVGVNLGRLGFLASFAPSEARTAIAAALAGKLTKHAHMCLAFTFIRKNGERTQLRALNDAVIHQGAMARLVEIHATLDGQRLTSYLADGLIIATPTGSTAYNLAAGGPIVVPGQAALILTPICSHSLTERPLVISATSRIDFELGESTLGARVSVDGLWSSEFGVGDRVEIAAAPAPIYVLGAGRSYFDVMREKLLWGRRVTERALSDRR